MTDAAVRKADTFVRWHTLETIGPVCTVTLQLVFELGFDAIQHSVRHKSGFLVRSPRILRWRHDTVMTPIEDVGCLASPVHLQVSSPAPS